MKRVIITGAASGIGQGIAEIFLKNNCEVLMIDYNFKKLKDVSNEFKSISDKLHYLSGDLCSQDFRNEIFRYVQSEFNNVGTLVNCAGVFPSSNALDIDENEWDKVFDLNLKSVFFLTKGIVKFMIESRVENPNIVNITSAASEVARPGVAHYCSSKAALKMLTQVLSLEFAGYGIRVNAIGPGLVETETLKNSLKDEVSIKEHNEKISYSPLKRTATIEEIAEGVLFIASEKASYITGQNLLIDGGYSAGRVFQNTK